MKQALLFVLYHYNFFFFYLCIIIVYHPTSPYFLSFRVAFRVARFRAVRIQWCFSLSPNNTHSHRPPRSVPSIRPRRPPDAPLPTRFTPRVATLYNRYTGPAAPRSPWTILLSYFLFSVSYCHCLCFQPSLNISKSFYRACNPSLKRWVYLFFNDII